MDGGDGVTRPKTSPRWRLRTGVGVNKTWNKSPSRSRFVRRVLQVRLYLGRSTQEPMRLTQSRALKHQLSTASAPGMPRFFV